MKKKRSCHDNSLATAHKHLLDNQVGSRLQQKWPLIVGKFWRGNWWKASDADVESNQVRMRERMQGCRSLIVGCGQHPCGHWHQPLHMVDNSHCAWSPVHAQAANIHRFCISIWYILYLGIPQSVCRTSWHQIASPGGIFRLATALLILYRMFNCA